ncbi:hypothetical protein [Halorhodospira neutriphila]|uniref:Uncharacterized protein n=1 Tax=Halorhodospira neutriphila TaxID=168379 RepID=A0ABS1E528_9GAMM|nr:hypothetical protein [Halorhodospira neutriphila]MBK1726304.1 hypothetical protein [Halorhodospira neutriphila]
MTEMNRRVAAAASIVLLGGTLLPGAAGAHGEAGEHVAEFEAHLEDYQADVETLSAELAELVEGYRAGDGAAQERVDRLIERWKAVEYHGAVEEVATPLYSPIWRRITNLRQAVEDGEEPAVVERRADALRAALHEGLGGVKLRASLKEAGQLGHDDHGHGEAEAADAEATLQRVREQLDEAVAAYGRDELEQARSLVETAYFEGFEGVEGSLIEADAQLVVQLEEAFNVELPGLMVEGAPTEEVEAQVASMKEDLVRCEELLSEADEAESEVF